MYLNVIRGSKSSKIPNSLKTCKYYSVDLSISLETWKLYIQFLLNEDYITENMLQSYGSTIGISQLGINWLIDNQYNPTLIMSTTENIPLNIPLTGEKLPTNNSTNSTNSKKNSPVDGTLTATVNTTYELLKDNKTISEIAKIRDLKSTTIEEHLVQIIKTQNINIVTHVPDYTTEIYDLIMNVITHKLNNDYSKLKPIKELCPDNISYLHIKIVIAVAFN